MLPNIKKSHGIQASLAAFYVPLIKFHLSNTQNPHPAPCLLFQFHVCIFTSLAQAFMGGQKLIFLPSRVSVSYNRVTKTSNPMEENATGDK